jgi:mevalonate kinase
MEVRKMRTQVKYFLICSVILVLGCIALAFGTSSQAETEKKVSDISSSIDEIVSMYNELIALRQQAVEEQWRLVQLGQASTSEMIGAEMKAAEARIQLAQFQGKKEAVVEELQNLVRAMTQLRNSLKMEIEVGMRSQTEIYEIDGSILEIKIRLAKTKQEQN